MSAWVRGNLLWKGRIFKKKSEIPQNDLTKPNIEGQVWTKPNFYRTAMFPNRKKTFFWRLQLAFLIKVCHNINNKLVERSTKEKS